MRALHIFAQTALHILFVMGKNKALLINLSCSYVNFRHSVNVQVFNQVLTKNAFSHSDIVIMMAEDQIQNARNPFLNIIMLNKYEFIKYNKVEPMKLTPQTVISTMRLAHKDLFELDENDNLLIYLCGHGKSGFVKICGIHYLFQGDLMNIINKLCTRLNKVLVIIDTCEAESLIDRSKIPPNGFVVTTSKRNENAYSTSVNKTLGVSSIDEFPYAFYRKILKPEMPLVCIFESLRHSEIKSTLTYCNKPEFLAKDFFFQAPNQSPRILYEFKL